MYYCNSMAAPFYNDSCEDMISSQEFFHTETEAYASAARDLRNRIADYIGYQDDEDQVRLRERIKDKSDKEIVELWANGHIVKDVWEWGWYNIGEVKPRQ